MAEINVSQKFSTVQKFKKNKFVTWKTHSIHEWESRFPKFQAIRVMKKRQKAEIPDKFLAIRMFFSSSDNPLEGLDPQNLFMQFGELLGGTRVAKPEFYFKNSSVNFIKSANFF